MSNPRVVSLFQTTINQLKAIQDIQGSVSLSNVPTVSLTSSVITQLMDIRAVSLGATQINDLKQVIVGNLPKSGFGEVKVVQRTPLIEVKSAVDSVSLLRNVVTTVGGGAVAISDSEYLLSTTAAASDSAILDTAERGRHLPGYEATVGIGIRTLTGGPAITGDMERRWGYFTNDDGYFFGEDATGIYVASKRAGVIDQQIYQASWNADKLNGTGLSGLTLDLTDGNIFQINYAWYGYGIILFELIGKFSPVGEYIFQKPVICHALDIRGKTSIEQPNLPIRAEIINGTTATAHSLYVSGRQYTISGKYNPNYRLTGEFRGSVSTSTTWVPLISFRRKSGSKFLAQSVKMDEFEIIGNSAPHILGFVLNGNLTGASWQTPTNHTITETVCESDVSATAITGGIFLGGFHIADASNKGRSALSQSGFDFDFIENQPVTLVVRTVSSTDSIVISSLNIREEW